MEKKWTQDQINKYVIEKVNTGFNPRNLVRHLEKLKIDQEKIIKALKKAGV